MSATSTQPEVTTSQRTVRKRHILELHPVTKEPTEKCLCGYVWDVFPVRHDPQAPICEECIEEARRRGWGAGVDRLLGR